MNETKHNLKNFFNKNPGQNDKEKLLKLFHSANYEKTKKITHNLLKNFKDSEFLYNMLGAIFSEENKYNESIKWHTKAIKINPNYAEGYNNLGAVLQKLGKLDEAIKNFKQAIKLKRTFAKAYSNLAISLTDQKKFDQAIKICQQAIKINPYFFEAHKNLGDIFFRFGKFSEALESYQQALKIKPGDLIVLHLISALSGSTTKTAPKEYIVKLFDNYSNHYDKHLTEKLKYQIPEKLVMILEKTSPIKLNFEHAIDMGCGTGLSGKAFRSLTKYLVGIDVSNKMIKKAKNKNIYDRLKQGDILTYLKKSSKKFDLFICADVFVYMGDLDEVFSVVAAKSNVNAKFCFSIEKCNSDEYQLVKSGRYAHSNQYIDRLSKKYKFTTEAYNETQIRTEKNISVKGYIFILKKV